MANKPRHKGIGYIAASLRKYGGKKYSSYKVSTEKARELKSQLTGKKVTIKGVMELVRKKRESKTKVTLPDSLTQPTNYWNLGDYSAIIKSVDSRIKIISKTKFGVIPLSAPAIQGGTEPDYVKFFKPFVDYCNNIKNNEATSDNYEDSWYVRCTQVNPKTLTSELISCDSSGNPFDYGFIESRKKKPLVEEVVVEKPIQKKPAPKAEEKIDKQITLEKEKQKTIELERQSTIEKLKLIKELKKIGYTDKEIKKLKLF